ncbi:MAG: hypothetical protein ACTS3F_14025 [Phycisphaerales bacterium]
MANEATRRAGIEGGRPGAIALFLGVAIVLACTGQAIAQLFGGGMGGGGPALVIENARIITMGGPVIERGSIVLQGGRITALGTDVEVPRRAMRINAEGKTITPGLIDVSSGLGMEPTGAQGSGVLRRAVDGFDPFIGLAFDAALRNGVTTVYIGPPSSNGFAGAGAVVRLAKRDDGGLGQVLEDEFDFVIDMTRGDALDRARAFEEVRGMFRAALNYRDAIDEYDEKLETYKEELKKYIEEWEKKESEKEKEGAGDQSKTPPAQDRGGRRGGGQQGGRPNQDEPKAPEKPERPEPNRDMEFLLRVLDGELRVRVRAEKDADILNALELASNFAIDITLEGAGEAWLLPDAIAEAESPVILGTPAGSALRFSTNEVRRHPGAYAALVDAGIQTLAGSGGAPSGSGLGTRFVLENAQLVMRDHSRDQPGMRALRLVTVDAARFLDLGPGAGTLRRGGQADLVLWSADPTIGPAAVEQVYIDGRPAFAARRGGQR